MSILDSYNNINTTNNTNPYAPQYPPTPAIPQAVQNNPNKPYEVTDARGNLTGYFWYYGNSVNLIWDIIGESTSEETSNYIEISSLIKGQTITAHIYDWKMQEVEAIKLNPEISDANVIVTLSISGELSQKLVKGVYYISLIATNTSGYNETLFDVGVCKFEVR